MYTQTGNFFDPTSDIYEIGLIAFASPEFAAALLREFTDAAQTADVCARSAEASQTRVAA